MVVMNVKPQKHTNITTFIVNNAIALNLSAGRKHSKKFRFISLSKKSIMKSICSSVPSLVTTRLKEEESAKGKELYDPDYLVFKDDCSETGINKKDGPSI